MKPEDIEKLLNRKLVVFGSGQMKINKNNISGCPYLFLDMKKKELKFTTDTRDYLESNNLEKVIENLFTQFKFSSYIINVHNHPGNNMIKTLS